MVKPRRRGSARHRAKPESDEEADESIFDVIRKRKQPDEPFKTLRPRKTRRLDDGTDDEAEAEKEARAKVGKLRSSGETHALRRAADEKESRSSASKQRRSLRVAMEGEDSISEETDRELDDKSMDSSLSFPQNDRKMPRLRGDSQRRRAVRRSSRRGSGASTTIEDEDSSGTDEPRSESENQDQSMSDGAESQRKDGESVSPPLGEQETETVTKTEKDNDGSDEKFYDALESEANLIDSEKREAQSLEAQQVNTMVSPQKQQLDHGDEASRSSAKGDDLKQQETGAVDAKLLELHPKTNRDVANDTATQEMAEAQKKSKDVAESEISTGNGPRQKSDLTEAEGAPPESQQKPAETTGIEQMSDGADLTSVNAEGAEQASEQPSQKSAVSDGITEQHGISPSNKQDGFDDKTTDESGDKSDKCEEVVGECSLGTTKAQGEQCSDGLSGQAIAGAESEQPVAKIDENKAMATIEDDEAVVRAVDRKLVEKAAVTTVELSTLPSPPLEAAQSSVESNNVDENRTMDGPNDRMEVEETSVSASKVIKEQSTTPNQGIGESAAEKQDEDNELESVKEVVHSARELSVVKMDVDPPATEKQDQSESANVVDGVKPSHGTSSVLEKLQDKQLSEETIVTAPRQSSANDLQDQDTQNLNHDIKRSGILSKPPQCPGNAIVGLSDGLQVPDPENQREEGFKAFDQRSGAAWQRNVKNTNGADADVAVGEVATESHGAEIQVDTSSDNRPLSKNKEEKHSHSQNLTLNQRSSALAAGSQLKQYPPHDKSTLNETQDCRDVPKPVGDPDKDIGDDALAENTKAEVADDVQLNNRDSSNSPKQEMETAKSGVLPAPSKSEVVEKNETSKGSVERMGSQDQYCEPSTAACVTKDDDSAKTHARAVAMESATQNLDDGAHSAKRPRDETVYEIPDSKRPKTVEQLHSLSTGAENPRFAELFNRKQPMDETMSRRRDLERVKQALFERGKRVHKGEKYSVLFMEYWTAISLKLCGNLPTNDLAKQTSIINKFLSTKKLRILHNKLILGLLERCSTRDFTEADITPITLGHIGTLIKPKQCTPIVAKPHVTVHDPELVVADESLAKGHETPTLDESSSSRIPGALLVDPFVRALAQSQGMKVNEGAVWLVVVAVKEFAKTLLSDCISTAKSTESNLVPPKPRDMPQFLSQIREDDESRLNDGLETPVTKLPPTKVISSLDVLAVVSRMPISARSLTGCVSRVSYERSLKACHFGRNDGGMESAAFNDVRKYCFGKIAPPPEAPRIIVKPSKAVDVPSPLKNKTTGVNPASTNPIGNADLAKHVESASSPTIQKVDTSKPLGKSSKDLSALVARSTAATRAEPTPGSGAAAPVSSDTQVNESSPRVQRSGAKNLAAMIVRSSQDKLPSEATEKASLKESSGAVEVIDRSNPPAEKPEKASSGDTNATLVGSAQHHPPPPETAEKASKKESNLAGEATDAASSASAAKPQSASPDKKSPSEGGNTPSQSIAGPVQPVAVASIQDKVPESEDADAQSPKPVAQGQHTVDLSQDSAVDPSQGNNSSNPETVSLVKVADSPNQGVVTAPEAPDSGQSESQTQTELKTSTAESNSNDKPIAGNKDDLTESTPPTEALPTEASPTETPPTEAPPIEAPPTTSKTEQPEGKIDP